MFKLLKRFFWHGREGVVVPDLVSGQSLIDIMIGLALVSLSIGLAAILVYGGQDVLIDRENTIRARALAHEGLEAARAILASDWSGTSDGPKGISFASGTWTFVGTSSVSEMFTRVVYVNATSSDLRVVRSVVSWDPTPTRPRSVELTTLTANLEEVVATGGDTGGGGSPSGDWEHPQTLGSMDLGPGNSASDLDVKGGMVYISATASDKKKPDFFVVNATNGQSPYIIGSVNTGDGLNAVDVAGTYAYVAHGSGTKQLQVIDVSNGGAPRLAAELTLPIGEQGTAIFYWNGRVYIGTTAGAGPEFYIIDVSTPSTPQVMGSFEVGASVRDIWVAGNIAYLATSASTKELLALNVTDPGAIVNAGSYDANGAYGGVSVFVSGTTVYFGDGGSPEAFSILDASALPVITFLGSANVGSAAVNDIYVRAPLAFIGTSNPNSEFQVWNIASSSAPVLWSSYNFPQVATGVDYENNLVYVSVRSNDALRIITSSP
ncbi:MAG: hypothetical protein Q8P88_02740 [Candidatus Jorgensenbacteria bacterium]|nr:hypothetical protein [Candidatus Jorgensenbacteria bacterium]